jgi:hypothetical protein
MHELTGNMFDIQPADAICFTSNGRCRKDGSAIMAGIALAFARMWPWLPDVLGQHLRTGERYDSVLYAEPPCLSCRNGNRGNHVHYLGQVNLRHGEQYDDTAIFSFPTKDSPWEMSLMDLIARNTRELVGLVTMMRFQHVLLPRPGCSLGRLLWDDVKPIIEQLLDDRFTVMTHE